MYVVGDVIFVYFILVCKKMLIVLVIVVCREVCYVVKYFFEEVLNKLFGGVVGFFVLSVFDYYFVVSGLNSFIVVKVGVDVWVFYYEDMLWLKYVLEE